MEFLAEMNPCAVYKDLTLVLDDMTGRVQSHKFDYNPFNNVIRNLRETVCINDCRSILFTPENTPTILPIKVFVINEGNQGFHRLEEGLNAVSTNKSNLVEFFIEHCSKNEVRKIKLTNCEEESVNRDDNINDSILMCIIVIGILVGIIILLITIIVIISKKYRHLKDKNKRKRQVSAQQMLQINSDDNTPAESDIYRGPREDYYEQYKSNDDYNVGNLYKKRSDYYEN